MQPEPDEMLEIIATKLIEQVVPQVDDYLKGDLQLAALIIRAAAERFDVAADVLLREHRALTAIFAEARQYPQFADINHEAVPEPASCRLRDLRDRNRRELELLTLLDVRVEEAGGEPHALKGAIDRFLRDRTVLHAFNAGPFPAKDLAERQAGAMGGSAAPPHRRSG